MKKIIFAIVVSVFVCAEASPLFAEITLSSYKYYSNKQDDNGVKSYLSGVSDGYSWANTRLESNGKKPLFCVPDELSIKQSNIIDILDRQIKYGKAWYENDTRIPLILLDGFIRTFPCK
jgi:hypothetical protein